MHWGWGEGGGQEGFNFLLSSLKWCFIFKKAQDNIIAFHDHINLLKKVFLLTLFHR